MSLATANWTNTSITTLIPGVDKIAAIFGIPLSDITPASRQVLFDAMGSATEYTSNAKSVENYLQERGVSLEEFLKLADVAMTHLGYGRRSVYGPVRATSGNPVTVILTGGTVNWMTRRVAELVRMMNQGLQVNQIIALGGDRICDGKPELTHPAVIDFHNTNGHYANERELMGQLAGRLGDVQMPVLTGNLEAQVLALLQLMPELASGPIYVPTNTVSQALQVRRVIQSDNSDFDTNPTAPDITFSQDSFPLARTELERGDPANFQNIFTLPSAWIRLIDELLRLQGLLS